MIPLKELSAHSAVLLFSRILLGGVFTFSGLGKLTHPTEEFIAILRNYHLLPEGLLRPFAEIFPWVEILFGVFLIIGLFYRMSLLGTGGLLLLLTGVIGVTLLRGISIEDCGCFKSFGIKESGGTAFFRNIGMLLVWLNLYLNPREKWTMDRLFRESDN